MLKTLLDLLFTSLSFYFSFSCSLSSHSTILLSHLSPTTSSSLTPLSLSLQSFVTCSELHPTNRVSRGKQTHAIGTEAYSQASEIPCRKPESWKLGPKVHFHATVQCDSTFAHGTKWRSSSLGGRQAATQCTVLIFSLVTPKSRLRVLRPKFDDMISTLMTLNDTTFVVNIRLFLSWRWACFVLRCHNSNYRDFYCHMEICVNNDSCEPAPQLNCWSPACLTTCLAGECFVSLYQLRSLRVQQAPPNLSTHRSHLLSSVSIFPIFPKFYTLLVLLTLGLLFLFLDNLAAPSFGHICTYHFISNICY